MSRHIEISNACINEFKTTNNFIYPDVTTKVSNCAELLYPHKGPHSCYKEGDFMFTGKIKESFAAMEYKEFEASENGSFGWGALFKVLLDIDDIEVTQEILLIQGEGRHARVVLKPYMKISKTEMLELTYKNGSRGDVCTMADMEYKYLFGHLHDVTKIWIPISKAMFEIISIPIGGGGKAIAKKLMAPLIKKGAIKITRKLLKLGGKKLARAIMGKVTKKLVTFSFNVSKDTVKGTVKKYFEVIKLNNARGNANSNGIDNAGLKKIISDAVIKSVADNVTKEIISGIEGLVPGGKDANIFPQKIKNDLTSYVTKKLLSGVLKPLTEVIKASIMAVDFSNNSTTYSQRLHEEVQKKMKTEVSTKLIKDLIYGAVKDLVKRPELLLG